MVTIAFPNIIPEIQDFGLNFTTQVSTTSLSGVAQTVELPGARWRGSMSFRDMTVADSADLKVFFVDAEYKAGWKDSSKQHLLY